MHTYGASPQAWKHWSVKLGLTPHLLPVVSNPTATISPDSSLAALGKVPSDYNFRGQARGFPKWTMRETTREEIEVWAGQPDYGICVQSREGGVRAIDIDIPNPRLAKRVRDAIEDLLPWYIFPVRGRPDSGKILLAFRLEGVWPKRVVPADGGIIEILGDGQQFIAVGTHTSGQRYVWEGGMPDDFPVLDEADFLALWGMLVNKFAVGEPTIARQRRRLDDIELPDVDDPLVPWLLTNWEVHDVDGNGAVHILCPFNDEHTSESGATATSYFPAGTGGYEQGHFSCLHAHCAGRDDHAFKEALGYTASLFPMLEPAPEQRAEEPSALVPVAEPEQDRPWPRLVRDGAGKIEPTADNLTKVIAREDITGFRIAYDGFRDEIVVAPTDTEFHDAKWRPFSDADYIAIRISLERRGVKPMGKEMLRDCVNAVALEHPVDIAKTWLSRLQWDGVERIERFFPDYLGTEDSDYSRALGLYAWSAHAGRIMEPGVKADIVPVLIGPQGFRKSSAIEAIAPIEEMFAIIDLEKKEDDLARTMRGVLVGELAELRGLATRDAESIKEWIVRKHEKWVPKFREFSTKYPRRLLFWGTGNTREILADSTGNRRWAPILVTKRCDTDAIERDRLQLWAEGGERFALEGVLFDNAEKLAEHVHHLFLSVDPWAPAIAMWLESDVIDLGPPSKWEKGLDPPQVASGALNIAVRDMNKAVNNRIVGVLKALGYERSSKKISRNRYIKVAE